MIKRLLTLSTILLSTSLFAAVVDSGPQIEVNNRVLAKINGNPISVIDLMKKMDFIFYREFPQYADVAEARFQFFSTNWKNVLNEMIDAELIIASAKDVKLKITDGEVRQEIEKIFGPNVVGNIDKLGMTYQEVFKLVQNDLTIKSMSYAMAQVPALNKVGPKEIRQAYDLYVKEHPVEESWEYCVISIKAPNQLKGKALAELSYKLLTENNVPPSDLHNALKEHHLITEDASISVSEDFLRKKSELSEAHKEALLKLEEGAYSQPLFQVSRVNNKQALYRIFFIKKHTTEGFIPFADVEGQLKNELLDRAMVEETERYRKKLRTRFCIDDNYLKMMLPDGFEPFHLTAK